MKQIIILSFLLFTALLVHAQEEEITPPAQEQKENGPGWQENTIFRVGASVGLTGLKTLDGSDELGTLQDPATIDLMLGYDSAAYYFGYTNWGFFTTMDAGFINISHQYVNQVGDEFEDLGTRLKGFYAYYTPAFFYNWGDRTFRNTKDLRLRVALGLGVGYLNLKGNIVFTETADTSKHSISMIGLHLAPVFMVEYRWGSWILRSTAHYLFQNKDGYTHTFIDGSVDIGYTFEF